MYVLVISADLDYVQFITTLVFCAGETELIVAVEIINDTVVEEDEVFGATLSNPSTGLALGQNDSAVITIVDNQGLDWHL